MEISAQNLNIASILLSRLLLKKGVRRKTRGFDCIELDEPVLVKITNPTDRYINIKERKNHKVLPFAESLALATGVNHMDLYASYVPQMMQYSDDGQFQRAGYGPRIRAFTGIDGDYKIEEPSERRVYSGNVRVVDQLKFVVDSLRKDINTRQAVITIHDPAKDCFGSDFELLKTKDQPCSRSIQFMVVDGKLNATLYIRSNDLLYGFQAVNVFNFTWMQECVAAMVGVPVGTYYHFANNLHYYSNFEKLVHVIASKVIDDFESEFGVWQYPFENRLDLYDFDNHINSLFWYEKSIRTKEISHSTSFLDPMFRDWANVFFMYHTKSRVEFINPYLNKLFNR